ncbi:MAG TPA: ROK family protein, partial [Caldisericia bacterium]|nr:ROK family protein [Caldisericia bacterium]
MSEFGIGIDIGGTKILFNLIDEDGKVFKKGFVKTGDTNEEKRIIEDMIKMINSIKEGFNVESIGIGCAGFIDYKKGVVIKSPNINFLENYPLKNIIEDNVKIPTFIDNDVKMGAIGELFFGEGVDSPFFIFLTLGTGIGGAIVYKNKLIRGINNFAGEVGHITLDKEGIACGCGKKGCFEKLSSGGSIKDYVVQGIKMGRKTKILDKVDNDIQKIDTIIIMDLAFENDELCVEAVLNSLQYVGLVVSYLINIFNPDKIIIGGGLTKGLGYFFNRIIDFAMLYSL